MEEEVSARVQSYPRDFLRRFGSGGGEELADAKKGELCDMELSLGLSLGGCSGAEPKERCFVRSPSIDTLSVFPLGSDLPGAAPLVRTCSLPANAEEEQRKRKELQSLKRLEAKRKRSEKKRFRAGAKDRKDDILDEQQDDGQSPAAASGAVDGVIPPLPPTPARKAGAQMVDGSKCLTPETQVSIGSQGSSYSGASDFDCRPKQGFHILGSNNHAEVRGFSTTTLLPEQINPMAATDPTTSTTRKPVVASRAEEDDKSWKVTGRANGVTKEVERDMMQEMPCVSAKGDGPNGRRIEGFLYKYRKGEDVRIVCVCHGRFFTPAEFVKHAGGGDVSHPLRHIVVNPSPAAFL